MRRQIAVVVVAALLIASCGSESSTVNEGGTSTEPTAQPTTSVPATTTTVDDGCQRYSEEAASIFERFDLTWGKFEVWTERKFVIAMANPSDLPGGAQERNEARSEFDGLVAAAKGHAVDMQALDAPENLSAVHAAYTSALDAFASAFDTMSLGVNTRSAEKLNAASALIDQGRADLATVPAASTLESTCGP